MNAKLDTTSFNNTIANYMLSADINTALNLKVDNTTLSNYNNQTISDNRYYQQNLIHNKTESDNLLN